MLQSFFPPRPNSNFISAMSSLPVILVVNLSAKNNRLLDGK